ncbi:hypothetical protein [Baekduia sp.]|jgi:hypothetical protein|uniref:hypothetical protein n=1 Tax=Baekduia sp. TaxID=2600305 RepID=UPI002DF8E08E|nr:hypothetical protein [Baekduia sp.]
MTDAPPKTVVFLHGIRDDDPEGRWLEALDGSLARIGRGSLRGAGFVSIGPSWLEHLAGPEPEVDPGSAPLTYVRGTDEQHRAAAAEYYLRTSALERTIAATGVGAAGVLRAMPEEAHEIAGGLVAGQVLSEVEAYCASSARRNACLRAVLPELPDRGEVVLIAHSLGSVLAADLVYALPPQIELRLLLSVGSPLSLRRLREHLRRARDQFPFERVGAWVNVVGTNDPITGGRGVGQVLPEVLDTYISTPLSRDKVHAATSYLDHEVVARAVNWLFDEDARCVNPGTATDVRLSAGARNVLALTQYALRLEQAMPMGDARIRFGQARRLLLSETADRLREHPDDAAVAARLSHDNSDLLRGTFTPDEATEMLLAMAMGNPVAPYAISYGDEAERSALRAFAHDLGHLASRADCVLGAEHEARDDHRAPVAWRRRAAVLAGVATVVVAPYLALAAAPAGLAGGAGIVAGLAALGPGGMIGGIGTISLLSSLSGAAVLRGLIAGSAEAVEQRVIFLQGLAYAGRDLHEHSLGRRVWPMLLEMEATLTAEHARLAEFSDERAVVLRELQTKCASVRRALDTLARKGLGPAVLDGGEAALPRG